MLYALSNAGDSITLRLPGRTVPFTPELQDTYRAAVREELTRPGGMGYDGTLESNIPEHFPETVPRYTGILVSEQGDYWLKRWVPGYGRTGGTQPYDVVSSDGVHIATVDIYFDARLLWADGNHVLLLERDDLDVQFLRLRELSGSSANVLAPARQSAVRQ